MHLIMDLRLPPLDRRLNNINSTQLAKKSSRNVAGYGTGLSV